MLIRRTGKAIDFLATTVAVVAVWTGTAFGGAAEGAIRKIAGLGPSKKPLVAHFDLSPERAKTRVVDPKDVRRPLKATTEQDETVTRIAKGTAVPPALARAFAVVASAGRVAMDDQGTPWYDVRPLEHHNEDRLALGMGPMTDGGAAVLDFGLRSRLADSLDLLSAYEARLGGEDAALAAWALGLPLIERAVSRARLVGERSPGDMDALEPFLARHDLEKAKAFVTPVQALRVAYEMLWPLDGSYPITSPFGMRRHPIHGTMRLHAGVDLGAPEGTPIRAVADGVVTYAGKNAASGLHLKLDHGHELETSYLHTSRLLVENGERVEAGRVIAHVGDSGVATGAHLHFGVYVGGRAVNPLVFRPPDMELSFELRDRSAPPKRYNPGRN